MEDWLLRNVVVNLVQCSGQLLSLAACFGIDIPFEVFQDLQRLGDIPVPEKSLHALQFLLEPLSFVLDRNPFGHLA